MQDSAKLLFSLTIDFRVPCRTKLCRTKLCRTKYFVEQNFPRLAKISSLLSENMLNSIVLGNVLDKIIRRTKLFVGQKFRRLAKISSVLSDIVLSGKVCEGLTKEFSCMWTGLCRSHDCEWSELKKYSTRSFWQKWNSKAGWEFSKNQWKQQDYIELKFRNFVFSISYNCCIINKSCIQQRFVLCIVSSLSI